MRIVIILFIVFATMTARAQDSGAVILRAMKDEMKRNMDELALEGHSKPFFISYQITDSREVSVSATLGGIMRSSEFPSRNKNVRVMVGDYDFNDESLDLEAGTGNEGMEISMPVDDDYYGIRRSLWGTTDQIYRSAARIYKENLEFVKKQKKELKDIPHRSFAKAPITTLSVKGPVYTIDKPALEKLAKDLSEIFKSYPDINASTVYINCSHTDNYFINSEGFEIKTPTDLTSVMISAQTKSAEGELLFDNVSYTALMPDKLPSAAMMRDDVKKMADRLITLRTTEVYKDSYTGPALFIGNAAADLLSTSLFSFGETLVAPKSINTSYSTSDVKIGKKIIAEGFTVKSMPKLKKYNNTELLGSFEVDDEGIVPPDELVLIENGVLKNQMSDRTITREGQVPNGHGSGPGVIAVSYNGGQSMEKLKALLIAKAKEEGLNYAILVRHFSGGGIRSKNTYKVSLEDGSETLVRSANVKSVNLKALKKIMGVSSEQIISHSPGGRYGGSVSIIAPNAILLEEVEVDGHRTNPYLDKEEYVESPLKNNK